MPTPSTQAPSPSSPPINTVIHRYQHPSSCPPEEPRSVITSLIQAQASAMLEGGSDTPTDAQADVESPSGSTDHIDPATPSAEQQQDHGADSDGLRDSPSPVDAADDKVDHAHDDTTAKSPSASVSLPPTFVVGEPTQTKPVPKHTSSFLRNGTKFVGTQQSDRQVYNVQVEVKHVDMSESFICGYLRIEGLTADHPTLTTYFEGEIIGNKYTFQTRHPEWGSNDKVDMQHWNRFPAWRPLARAARRPDFSYKNYAERENVFMRWKEYFLVPDHRVRTISGASFEGFYYICFNQLSGGISGIYYHSKSEKFQQLELKHVDDRGCMGAMAFR